MKLRGLGKKEANLVIALVRSIQAREYSEVQSFFLLENNLAIFYFLFLNFLLFRHYVRKLNR